MATASTHGKTAMAYFYALFLPLSIERLVLTNF